MTTELLTHAGTAGIGVLALLGGASTLYVLGRRRFERLNFAGIEEFTGYGWMLLTRVFEGTLKLAAWLAILAGLAIMLMGVKASGVAKPRAAAPEPTRVVSQALKISNQAPGGARTPSLLLASKAQ